MNRRDTDRRSNALTAKVGYDTINVQERLSSVLWWKQKCWGKGEPEVKLVGVSSGCRNP